MALRALNSVVAANYNKQTADPVLAGDLVTLISSATVNTNPACIKRAVRNTETVRYMILGVCADDSLGQNPNGETPTMINNDPVGSNFVNGNNFQTYTNGFYVGVKRAISDYKDEGISVVTNLTQGVPTFEQRTITVYTTPSSQFVTDRFALLTGGASSDSALATFNAGDPLTVGYNNGSTVPVQPTVTTAGTGTNNAGLLIKWDGTNGPCVGRVDYYDSGAGLLYWTLV
jgi:hypothetical protein